MAFELLLQLMIDAGASYVFMWLLFAGLIYGVLQKYEVFGESSANAGISLGGSFFTLLGVYSFAPEGLFLSFAASLGFILIAIFGLIILLSMAGVNIPELTDGIEGQTLPGIALILILIGFLGSLVYTLDWSNLLSGVENAWQEVAFPIIFLIFLLLVISSMNGGGGSD